METIGIVLLALVALYAAFWIIGGLLWLAWRAFIKVIALGLSVVGAFWPQLLGKEWNDGYEEYLKAKEAAYCKRMGYFNPHVD